MKPSIRPWTSAPSCRLLSLSSRSSSLVARVRLGKMAMSPSCYDTTMVPAKAFHTSPEPVLNVRTKTVGLEPPSIGSFAGGRPSRSSSTAASIASKLTIQRCSKNLRPSPTTFLRAFSTTSPLGTLASASGFASLVLSKMPRPRWEDSPDRRTNRSRRYPSPLFDRSPRRPPTSSSSSNSGNSGRPWRRPPSSSFLAGILSFLDRRLFSGLPENFVIYTILALNAIVFCAWLYASQTLHKFSDPRLTIFLAKNFLSGYRNVSEGRWWTMLTSCVSHEHLQHFLLNMISFSFMAPPILALTGPTTFVLLYFGAGMVSSIVSMVGKNLIQSQGNPSLSNDFSHGASGSIYAIMSAFACVQPNAKFLIFFVIPAPAWACVVGIFAWDLWHAAKAPGDKTDSAGHIGGILAGILFWKFGLRGIRFH